ncbi:unnamed protein product, partial [marine sediment metagenome]
FSLVAVTYDGNDIIIYINGSEVYKINKPGSIGTGPSPLCFGTYALEVFF